MPMLASRVICPRYFSIQVRICDLHLRIWLGHSRVAQRERAGPITQRSMDRNHPLLQILCFYQRLTLLLFGFSAFNLFSCYSVGCVGIWQCRSMTKPFSELVLFWQTWRWVFILQLSVSCLERLFLGHITQLTTNRDDMKRISSERLSSYARPNHLALQFIDNLTASNILQSSSTLPKFAKPKTQTSNEGTSRQKQ